jgi:hypothetical protein
MLVVIVLRLMYSNSETDASESANLALMEEITRCLYASLLIQVSFRTLQFLRYFQSIGVLIIVLAEMMNDVGTPHAPFRSR